MGNILMGSKKSLTIEYCNLGDAYAKIKINDGNKSVEKVLEFSNYQLNDGLLINDKLIIDCIKEMGFNSNSPLNLVLKTNDIFIHKVFIPKMSTSATNKLRMKDLRTNFTNFQANYYVLSNEVPNDLGTVCYYYFIPNKYIEYFKIIAKKIKTTLGNISLFCVSLAKLIDKKESNYALVYQRGKAASFICIINKKIACAKDVLFTDRADFLRKFAVVVGQHEIELEQYKFTKIYIDGDTDFELSKEFEDVQFIPIDLSKTLKENKVNKGSTLKKFTLSKFIGAKDDKKGKTYIDLNKAIDTTPKVDVNAKKKTEKPKNSFLKMDLFKKKDKKPETKEQVKK